MILGDELHSDLPGIISEAAESWRDEVAHELFDKFDRRCPDCDGNGVHPELLDTNGDPAPRMVSGLPYYFSVRCDTCNGTGEIGRWPKESAAPSTQGSKRSGRTAQRGGHVSGGGA